MVGTLLVVVCSRIARGLADGRVITAGLLLATTQLAAVRP